MVLDYVQWAHSTIDTQADQPAEFRIRTGLMGHPLAPSLFLMDYNRAIGEWNSTANVTEPMAACMITKCPFTHIVHDLSLSTCVDDVAKAVVSNNPCTTTAQHEQFCSTATQTARKLDIHLEGTTPYRLNAGKAVTLLHLQGKGAHAALRRAHVSEAHYGQLARQARYLGVQLTADGSASPEIQARLAATKQLGSVWSSPSPYRILRVFFFSFVVNTLVAGLTPFLTTPRQEQKLTGLLYKLMKYAWMAIQKRRHTQREPRPSRACIHHPLYRSRASGPSSAGVRTVGLPPTSPLPSLAIFYQSR
jgi:hypothetical protein